MLIWYMYIEHIALINHLIGKLSFPMMSLKDSVLSKTLINHIEWTDWSDPVNTLFSFVTKRLYWRSFHLKNTDQSIEWTRSFHLKSITRKGLCWTKDLTQSKCMHTVLLILLTKRRRATFLTLISYILTKGLVCTWYIPIVIWHPFPLSFPFLVLWLFFLYSFLIF